MGETLIGSWCELASPISTEILGLAGFYWLVLDGEHAPNDITTFVPQLMALKGSHSVSVVRSALYSDSMASEQLDNVRRMLLAMVEDFRCVVLKLAERIMNLREMKDVPEAGR